MKILNLDMHISVARDIQELFRELGVQLERHSLSGHNWVEGLPQSKLSAISRANWQKIGPSLVEKFVRKNQSYLENFDAFLVSYPPVFATLFEPFGKPIISVTCTRFDFPVFPERYQWMAEGLRRMATNGQLTSVANNRLDQFYNERFLGLPTGHIQSLCSYLSTEDIQDSKKFLVWSRSSLEVSGQLIDENFSISRPYNRAEIPRAAGIIHIPYNLSIMSAFEHYWQGLPMVVPSEQLLGKLWRQGSDVLSEVLFPETLLYFDESLISLGDWYSPEVFDGVIYFDSFSELPEILSTIDRVGIREKMLENNKARRASVIEAWGLLLESVRL